VGSNVNGSSLPNCSGLPIAWNLSERAFDRWIASAIIAGVAVVRGFLVFDKVAADVDVDVDVDVDIDVDVDVEIDVDVDVVDVV
jgi:hypothetical protein